MRKTNEEIIDEYAQLIQAKIHRDKHCKTKGGYCVNCIYEFMTKAREDERRKWENERYNMINRLDIAKTRIENFIKQEAKIRKEGYIKIKALIEKIESMDIGEDIRDCLVLNGDTWFEIKREWLK